MCVRDFQTLTLCRPKFRQNFGPFADKWQKIFENRYPKMPEKPYHLLYGIAPPPRAQKLIIKMLLLPNKPLNLLLRSKAGGAPERKERLLY